MFVENVNIFLFVGITVSECLANACVRFSAAKIHTRLFFFPSPTGRI